MTKEQQQKADADRLAKESRDRQVAQCTQALVSSAEVIAQSVVFVRGMLTVDINFHEIETVEGLLDKIGVAVDSMKRGAGVVRRLRAQETSR